MYKVYEELLKQKGVKTSDVCKATGLRQSLFSDWKAGRYVPKLDKLQKIADYFGVPVGTFSEKSEPMTIRYHGVLSGMSKEILLDAVGRTVENMFEKDELQLIDNYRNLNDSGKQRMLAYMQDLMDMPKYTASDDAQGKLSDSESA